MNRVKNIYTEYYNNYEGKVNNSDVLVRIIKMATPEPGLPTTELMSRIDDYYPEVLRHFTIISSLSLGAEKYTYFDSRLVEDYFSITKKNYMQTNVMKVIETNDLDDAISLDHIESVPDGDIICIDIKALLVSYYRWATVRRLYEYDTDPSKFVFQVVYTNAVFSRFEYAVFKAVMNRIKDPKYKYPVVSRKNPIAIQSYDSLLYYYMDSLVREYTRIRNTAKFDVLIHRFQLPYSGDLSKYLYTDYGYVNVNNEKAIWAVELERLFDIVEIQGGKRFIHRNTDMRIILDSINRKLYGINSKLKQPILVEKIKKEKQQLKKILH